MGLLSTSRVVSHGADFEDFLSISCQLPPFNHYPLEHRPARKNFQRLLHVGQCLYDWLNQLVLSGFLEGLCSSHVMDLTQAQQYLQTYILRGNRAFWEAENSRKDKQFLAGGRIKRRTITLRSSFNLGKRKEREFEAGRLLPDKLKCKCRDSGMHFRTWISLTESHGRQAEVCWLETAQAFLGPQGFRIMQTMVSKPLFPGSQLGGFPMTWQLFETVSQPGPYVCKFKVDCLILQKPCLKRNKTDIWHARIIWSWERIYPSCFCLPILFRPFLLGMMP